MPFKMICCLRYEDDVMRYSAEIIDAAFEPDTRCRRAMLIRCADAMAFEAA